MVALARHSGAQAHSRHRTDHGARTGELVERYEYAAYVPHRVKRSAAARSQRERGMIRHQPHSKPCKARATLWLGYKTKSNTNDPLALTAQGSAPRVLDGPFVDDGTGLVQPYSINPFGHQGLYHDEHLGPDAIQNRARYRRSTGFLQRDPLGYPDGMNTYASYHILHQSLDPSGMSPPKDLQPQKHGLTTITSSSENPWETEMFQRTGERPCFEWNFKSQGRALRLPDGDVRFMNVWQLYVDKIDYALAACFCCPDGSEAMVQLKQWRKRYKRPAGDDQEIEVMVAWGPDMTVPSNQINKELVESRSGGNAGPIDFENTVGTHTYPDPRAARGEWQPNRIEHTSTGGYYSEAERRALRTGVSWYDGPGATITTGHVGKTYSQNPQLVWHFYVEIWRDCPGKEHDRAVDKAHLMVGSQYKSNPGNKAGVKFQLKVQAPIWMK